jgi:3-phenylpropionate/trans-cinnamate dioxygenase ferredoxin component
VSVTDARVRLGRAGDLADGAARFEVDGRPILVVRLDEELVAVDDICTHEEASLFEVGEVDPEFREIECCRHGARFSLDDGSVCSLPATSALRTYRVELEGDDLFLELTPRAGAR